MFPKDRKASSSSKDPVRPSPPDRTGLTNSDVMLGYLNRPEANAETLIEDKDGVWLKTGDIAYVDSDSFFFITDRLKELIKYSGHQIPPAQLEAELLNCPWVSDVAVVGVYVEDRATEFPRAYGTSSPASLVVAVC